jgi:hypothetical protein
MNQGSFFTDADAAHAIGKFVKDYAVDSLRSGRDFPSSTGDAAGEVNRLIFIAQCDAGDTERGSISGVVKSWWVVEGENVLSVRRPPGHPCNESGPMSRYFVVRFFRDGNRVAISERYGPDLIVRRVGRLAGSEKGIEFVSERVVWKTTPDAATPTPNNEQL